MVVPAMFSLKSLGLRLLRSSFVLLADYSESGLSLLDCPESPFPKGNLYTDFLYPHSDLAPLKTPSY